MLDTRNPWEINQTSIGNVEANSKQVNVEVLAGKIFFWLSTIATTIGIGLLAFVWLTEQMGMKLAANVAVGMIIPGTLLSFFGVSIGLVFLKFIVAYVRETQFRLPAAILLMAFSVGVGYLAISICQNLDEYQGRRNPVIAVAFAIGCSVSTFAASLSLLRRKFRSTNKSVSP